MTADDTALRGLDILAFGRSEWLLVQSLPEYTVSGLAHTNRVLYVEPFMSLYTLRRMAKWQARRVNLRWGLRPEGPRLWIYTPPPLGLPGASRARWPGEWNASVLARLLARPMRALGFEHPLVWTFLHDSAAVVGRLPRRLTVYDCGDHHEALAPTPRRARLLRAREDRLCREADLVFAVTASLAELLRPHNPRTFEVPCAADPAVFGRAVAPDTMVPADIAPLPRPVLGYMGGVDPWKIDVDLLRFVARSRPAWSLVLVGYVWYGFDRAAFRDCPNIHVLGPKRYEELPGYLKGMDVCLMPFPLNGITLNGDALKCYEYLAAGKPVVSTPVPAAARFPGVVRTATRPADFLAAIEASLTEDTGAVERRLGAVRPHSWQARIAEKARLVLQALAEREASAPRRPVPA